MPPWTLSPSTTRVLLLALLLLPLLAGTAHAQSESVIDVAVFYTPQAKDTQGGTAQIKTKIDELVVATNMAYADSGVNQTINLVAVEEVVGYTEAGSTTEGRRTDLVRLQRKSDGYMDEVHSIRDRVRADAVILIRQGGGGTAYTMIDESTSYAMVAFGVSNMNAGTFVHELGHIMGLQHDRYVACDPDCGLRVSADAYGYVNQRAFDAGVPNSTRWRTIMAYPNQCSNANFSCERVLYFSNPDNCYPGDCPPDDDGDPMGVALTSSNMDSTAPDGPADAARTLNETRTTVANFRQGRAVQVSFDAGPYEPTDEGGSVTVTVRLDAAPGRTLDMPIPLTATSTDGAWPGDYTLPASITFGAGQTSRTFTFRTVQDTRQEGEETVILGFGAPLPAGVAVGSQATATVTLTDTDTVPAAPSVSTVALISTPGAGYAAGEEITVAVVFTKPITVTGTPSIGLTVGTTTRQALCQTVASEVLTCTYTVVVDESDTDGVSVVADSLNPNGGTIQDADNRSATDFTHAAVAANSGHTVDGDTPDLDTATVDGDTVTLTYGKTLDATSIPWANAFTVSAGGSTVLIAAVQVSGAVVTLRLVSDVVHTDSVTLAYSPPAGSPPLQDVAGNAAATLSSRTLTNNTPEPVYDTDDDGLIEITTLAQLDAMRHDLDGDGSPTPAGATAYAAAFHTVTRVVCGATSGGCAGYELLEDLDFDTNGDGQIDADDPYWNSGAGWQPIGFDQFSFFSTTFEGNGHTISHLFIKRESQDQVGLFGATGVFCVIRRVGLIDISVTGGRYVGGLVGQGLGDITESYATGRVAGNAWVGGLIGFNRSLGTIRASYTTGRVRGGSHAGGLVGLNNGDIYTSYATGRVSGSNGIGGLVGRMHSYGGGGITASYATGHVSGVSHTGGLVGSFAGGTIRVSYATGRVSSGGSHVGGLIGENLAGTTITASYWDTRTSGHTTGNHGEGKTSMDLQTPTDDSGIYADWDVDLDDDGTNDDPWDFGTSSQYPVLKVDFDGNSTASWQEFGQQLRNSPTLTADTTTMGQVALSWTTVTNHWGSAATITYTVTRDDTPLVEGTSTTTHTDTAVTSGRAYTYQVMALVDGGEGARSTRLTVTAVANQPPAFDDSTTTRSVAENTATGVAIGLPVSATDPDDTALTYSLSGTDAASFTLDTTTGQLRTAAALNYETKRRYTVTVAVRDGKNDDGETDTDTDDTITVTITVVNRDEAGTVTLSGTPPRELHQLTAALSDPDGVIGNPTWQWARSPNQSTWTDITGATATRYPPGAADVGQYLRATATYTDDQGSGTRAAAATTTRVQAAPKVTLHLSDTSISEDGTESSTVTVTLDTASSAVTTVTVTAPTSDIMLSGRTLTIAKETTGPSTGTVTLTAKDNTVDGPERKTVQVRGTTTNRLVADPDPVDLEIVDDDPAPVVELILSPQQISEKDQVSTVTARLNHPSSEATTVVVSAAPVHPAVAGDVTLSPNTTLTIPAGDTASRGTAVTLTSVDNDTDAPNKQVTVSGTATNNYDIAGNPADAPLSITDDEGPPVVTLTLSKTQIDESGGDNSATVTVELSHPSSEATTVTVTADPAEAVTLSETSLTISAGATEGTVTVTAVDNDIDAPDKPVTVKGEVKAEDYLLGTIAPATAPPLTITDDDDPPVVTLAVSPGAITENSGQSTVTATLDRPSSREIVVTVATASEYTLSANPRLTFPADETTSPDVVTLTARDNEIDAEDATVSVGGRPTPSGLTVHAANITIEDDDTRKVTVSPTTLTVIEDSPDPFTYTVVLESEPTAAVTVTVERASGSDDVSVSPSSLMFTTSNWKQPQTVRVSTRGDPTDDDETATITHTVSGGDYTGESPDNVDVTVEDDEALATAVTLSVNRTVPESSTGTVVTVTGTLNGKPRLTVTMVTVTVTAGTATSDDFDAVSPFDLTIPANAERGTETFTLTPVNDTIDEPDEMLTVDGSTTVGLDVTETTVTITDNDAPPTVELVLTPAAIREGASTQVTATLSHPSSEDTIVEVSATAVSPDTHFTLSGSSLTIPVGTTASSAPATLMATENTADEADKQVTVTGRATNTHGVQSPNAESVTLTITDDDPPEVTGADAPTVTEGERAVATYTASNPANVRLEWSLDGDDKEAFTISNGVLRFKPSPSPPPDYETQPSYDVTVHATDRSLPSVPLTGELAVTVTVEDAVGTVRLSSQQPRVGVALTATVSDRVDGVEEVTEWCWQRSRLPAFPATETADADCSSSTTGTYTPVAADVGGHLRVTVTYTDVQGTRKGELKQPLVYADTDKPVDPASRPQSSSSSGGGGSGGGGGGGVVVVVVVVVVPAHRTTYTATALHRPLTWPCLLRPPGRSVRPPMWIILR